MTNCATVLGSVGASGGGVGLANPAANPRDLATIEYNRHQIRFQRQLADEITQIADHGGKGSRQGLLNHLRHRFGAVEADDMLRAFDMLPTDIGERFE